MDIRRVLLRALLFALAAAACSGLLAVMIPGTNHMWRIAAMGVVAALCAGVMMQLTRFVDVRSSRNAGLFGMVICVIEFLLSIVLIWQGLFTGTLAEFVALAMVMLALTSVPAGFSLSLITSPASRTAGICGLIGMSAALIALIYASASSAFGIGGSDDRWWPSGFSIYFASLLGAACFIGWSKPDPHKWRWAGVCAAIVVLGLSYHRIWIMPSGRGTSLAAAYAVVGVVALANALLLLRLPSFASWIRLGAIAASAVMAAMICGVVHVETDYQDSFGFQRLAIGSGIVAASGILAILVILRLGRRTDAAHLARPIESLAAICPRCDQKLLLPIGAGSCPSCSLRFTITIQSPECPVCAYNLIGITTGQCPECGTPINARAPAPAA